MIDYIDFDSDGSITEVRCMICNTPVRGRRLHPVTGESILRTFGNYIELDVQLEEDNEPHSVASLVSCIECQYLDFDFDDMMDTVRGGWEKSLKAKKVKKKDIDETLDVYKNVKIKKKLKKDEKPEKKDKNGKKVK
jgi:hypothetical protein